MKFNRPAFFKLATAGVLVVAALLGATSASAAPNWSVGIDVPGVAIGVAQSGYYEPAPVYAAPPVYYQPAPTAYYRQASPAYYPPAPGYYEPGYRGEDRRFHRDWERDHHDRREWGREWERREHRREAGDRD